MRKKLFLGFGGLGILAFLLRLFFFGFEADIREAWAQQRTVLYKDFQQTVTTGHIYNNTTPGEPPFTVTGNSLGGPATGFAPDRIGLVPFDSLPSPQVSSRIRMLSDGEASGGIIVDDGVGWTCAEAKTQKIAMVTCLPFNAQGDGTDDAAHVNVLIEGNLVFGVSEIDQMITGGATTLASGNLTPGMECSLAAAVNWAPNGRRVACDVIEVGVGTGTITTVLGSVKDRQITLRFAGVVTVEDNAGQNLAGNFVSTTSDTLVLQHNGTNWEELSRSVN